jgi:hypothetical protein
MPARQRLTAVIGLVLTAACLVAAATAGCGGEDRGEDERAVAATLRGFLTDVFEEDDFKGACDRLAPAAKTDLIRGVRKALPDAPTYDCVGTFETLQSIGSLDTISGATLYVDPPRYEAPGENPADQEITDVSVNGDTARATVGENPQRVQLRRTGGTWRIARLVEPED